MTTVSSTVRASVPRVFATLLDPETYPSWLVGCKEIRSVDADWPVVGTEFHHRVGVAGPISVADSTEVLAIDPPHRLLLEVRGRPLGRGEAEFSLEPAAGGGTRVSLREEPIGTMRPTAPLLAPLTALRNRASLRRLGEYLDTTP